MKAEAAMNRLKKAVEEVTPYRPFTVGQVMKMKDGELIFENFPKNPGPTTETMMKDAKDVIDYHYKNGPTWPSFWERHEGGDGPNVRQGHSLDMDRKSSWCCHHRAQQRQPHPSQEVLLDKDLDKVCHLFIYWYILLDY